MTRGGGDTIFAQATGSGRAGIAIIRSRGRDAGALLDRLTRPRPRPRQASLRRLAEENGAVLDHAIVLWFPGPGSYTGEDCVELHLHAGPAVIEAVSDRLCRAGARPAEAGEFTQRAFMTGRLDLLEAEGIADLIEAETQAQRRQALAQSTGALSELYRSWMARLRRIVAYQEARIDFPDDTDEDVDDGLVVEIEELERALASHLSEGDRGLALRRGIVVALVGEPNVGKSSLLNRLSGRDVSIVSAQAGTTRDLVETRTVIGDVPVTLVDTAGLRESDDDVEREGVRRAKEAAKAADLMVVVTHGTDRVPTMGEVPGLWVANKIDLSPAPDGALGVSARTGEGIDVLRSTMSQIIQRLTSGSPLPMMTRSRHRDCVMSTTQHLRSALVVTEPELRGEELRLALHHLGRLSGAVTTDDILSDVFSTFCIGK